MSHPAGMVRKKGSKQRLLLLRPPSALALKIYDWSSSIVKTLLLQRFESGVRSIGGSSGQKWKTKTTDSFIFRSAVVIVGWTNFNGFGFSFSRLGGSERETPLENSYTKTHLNRSLCAAEIAMLVWTSSWKPFSFCPKSALLFVYIIQECVSADLIHFFLAQVLFAVLIPCSNMI